MTQGRQVAFYLVLEIVVTIAGIAALQELMPSFANALRRSGAPVFWIRIIGLSTLLFALLVLLWAPALIAFPEVRTGALKYSVFFSVLALLVSFSYALSFVLVAGPSTPQGLVFVALALVLVLSAARTARPFGIEFASRRKTAPTG